MKRYIGAALVGALVLSSGCSEDSKNPVGSQPDDSAGVKTFEHRVIFAIASGAESHIYTAGHTGANRLELLNGNHDSQPDGSPDGTRIAFVRQAGSESNIWVMHADGTGLTQLTSDQGVNSEPAWSPDGQRIAFKSDRDDQTEIYVMAADGSGQQRLTENTVLDLNPTWSPDGSQIAWASNRDAGDGGRNFEIYVMDTDGSNVVRLTNNEEVDFEPHWSPDGEHIVFTSDRDGPSFGAETEIYIMQADGVNQRRLTNDPGPDQHPKWSPDGSRIAWISASPRGLQAFVMFANGTGSVNVSNGATGNNAPGWLFKE